MPRNLVICCDGTNNQFGPNNTNVIRLIQVLDRDPARQALYYDPGVGTLPEPNAFTAFQKWLSKVNGLAFGAGLAAKVGQAYSFLMDVWEPGDRVYLFGFSRGAYAAHVLAGLLHSLGLLPRGNTNLVPYVLRLYESVRDGGPGGPGGSTSYWDLCDSFRQTFAREAVAGDPDRRFPVHFLGVWDTVSSYGWVYNPKAFPFTRSNPSVHTVRHAVSIDERRCFFRQNLMDAQPGQVFDQQWFPGVHCDVGGGYPEAEGGLWREPFLWMLEGAEAALLAVDQARLKVLLDRPPVSGIPWSDPIHDSLTSLWRPVEYLPKKVWQSDTPPVAVEARARTAACDRGRSHSASIGTQADPAHRRLRASEPVGKFSQQCSGHEHRESARRDAIHSLIDEYPRWRLMLRNDRLNNWNHALSRPRNEAIRIPVSPFRFWPRPTRVSSRHRSQRPATCRPAKRRSTRRRRRAP